MSKYEGFSKKFIIFLLMVILLNVIWSGLLGKLYEHNPLDEVIYEQHKRDAIYGSILNNNEFSYSTELVTFRKPAVIALGSSRVLPFRQEFFSEQFAGAGRAITQIKEAEIFLSKVLENGVKPEVVLFGIDFWWFHESLSKRNTSARHIQTEGEFASNKLRGFMNHVIQRRVEIGSAYRKVLYGAEKEDYEKYKEFHSLGLGALQNFSGLRKDGSYFYGNILTGFRKSPDIAFKSTLQRIKKGSDKFRHGQNISEDAWSSLMNFMVKARDNNIRVVLFYPPLSDKAYDAINREPIGYKYIKLLTERLEKTGVFFNFHNPTKLSATECEFVDGFHGGEVVYARLLKEMSKKVHLPLHVNLERYIDSYRNNALIKLNALEHSKIYKEIDFLEIGCEK